MENGHRLSMSKTSWVRSTTVNPFVLSLLGSVIAHKGRNGLHVFFQPRSARVGAVVAKSQDYTCSTSSFMVMSFMELEEYL